MTPLNSQPSALDLISIDLFCGAGGTSTGLLEACDELGMPMELVAINHWDIAIDSHSQNHPKARHLCMAVEEARPLEVVPRGRVRLLVASPKCQDHSNASGGKRLNEQSRADAWDVCRWAQILDIDNILIENVREFLDWGPIYNDCNCEAGAGATEHARACHWRRPVPERKGEYFSLFVHNLRKLSYTVEWRILRAADYGDPTTRKRFFLQARKGKRHKITWPEATHFPKEDSRLARPGRSGRPRGTLLTGRFPAIPST